MHILWVLSFVAFAYGLETTRLWQQPPPMKGFNIMPFLGRWFVQFRKAPCSWAASNEFTDFETYMTRPNKNTILIKETSRNEICNSATSLLYPGKQPGVFVVKDPLGDNMSGSYVVVATDYKSWSLTYGCTKMSVSGNKCQDPWLSVKTRMPHPKPVVLAQIDKAMWDLWRAALTDLQPVRHRQSCNSGGMKQG
ncbi:hypothetical protein ACF0H5_006190 [Mactra antiquata]